MLWIFDLDNTLHHASPGVFPHINRMMTDYIIRHLHVDEDTANRLRQHYWSRYGATLTGLVRHHPGDGGDAQSAMPGQSAVQAHTPAPVEKEGLRVAGRRRPENFVVDGAEGLGEARDNPFDTTAVTGVPERPQQTLRRGRAQDHATTISDRLARS